MTSEGISAAAGVILSLSFSYVPKLNQRYSDLSPEAKRLIMLGLLALVAIGAFGLTCSRAPFEALKTVTCDQAGAWGLGRALITAVVANQATFLISPKSKPQ